MDAVMDEKRNSVAMYLRTTNKSYDGVNHMNPMMDGSKDENGWAMFCVQRDEIGL